MVYSADDVEAIRELGGVDREKLKKRLDHKKTDHKGEKQWREIVECYDKRQTVGKATYHEASSGVVG